MEGSAGREKGWWATQLTKPRMTARGVLIAASGWLVYSFLMALPIAANERLPFVWAWLGQVLSSALLGLTSAPVWLLVVREMHASRWWKKLGTHLCIGPLYAYANYLLYELALGYAGGAEAASAVRSVRAWIVFTFASAYLVQFALYHSIEALRQLHVRERRAAELLAAARDQELAALKAQINPHFLFNALNSISAMASSDVDATRKTIARLGDLLRYAMESSKRDLVPLREELQCVASYLALEQQRLGDRLMVRYVVAEGDLDKMIPPLSIQPLVENAVRHGIEPCERGGTVTLTVTSDRRHVAISVRDTGVGVRMGCIDRRRDGIGLANTDARLRTMFGESMGLHCYAPSEGGFEAAFRVPLQR